jgi:LPS-assembly lipoprotein
MRTRISVIVVSFGVLTGLSGCGMRPLYATDGSSSVATELSSVAIPSADNRVGQIIRNDLLSSIRPAGTGTATRYTLELNTDMREDEAAKLSGLGVDRLTVVVNVNYRLKENASGHVVDEGKTFSQVSYDETGQSFADLRARDNAYERAAHEISQDIKSRLAAHFAKG